MRFYWEAMPTDTTANHLLPEGRILSHCQLVVSPNTALPEQPQLLGDFLLFYLFFFSLKK